MIAPGRTTILRPEGGRWLAVGAALAGLGVAAGAFGAHGLSEHLEPRSLAIFETAVRYHLLHALALVVTGLAADRAPHAGWQAAGWLFAVGILVFGGSLYALAFTGAGWLGAVTPLGGLCFLAGWAAFARTAWVLRAAAE